MVTSDYTTHESGMTLVESFKAGLRALLSINLRSSLTVLGFVIGVEALILLVSVAACA